MTCIRLTGRSPADVTAHGGLAAVVIAVPPGRYGRRHDTAGVGAGAERQEPPRTQGARAGPPGPAPGGTSAATSTNASRTHRDSCPMTAGHAQPDHGGGRHYAQRRRLEPLKGSQPRNVRGKQ